MTEKMRAWPRSHDGLVKFLARAPVPELELPLRGGIAVNVQYVLGRPMRHQEINPCGNFAEAMALSSRAVARLPLQPGRSEYAQAEFLLNSLGNLMLQHSRMRQNLLHVMGAVSATYVVVAKDDDDVLKAMLDGPKPLVHVCELLACAFVC